MKTIALFVVALVAIGNAQKLKQCKVAASCEYSDGTTRYQIRKLPTKKEAEEIDQETTAAPATAAPVNVGSCDTSDEGWFVAERGYQYMFSVSDVRYNDAESFCRSKGATVLGSTLRDPDALQYLKDFILPVLFNQNGAWVALSGQSGTWQWGNNEALPSNSPLWKTNQPDGSGPCVWIEGWNGADHKLDDVPCDAKFKVICERRKGNRQG